MTRERTCLIAQIVSLPVRSFGELCAFVDAVRRSGVTQDPDTIGLYVGDLIVVRGRLVQSLIEGSVTHDVELEAE